MRAKLDKFLEKADNAEVAKEKFFGTYKMTEGINNLCKRKTLRTVKPNIINYLNKKVKDKGKNKIKNLLPKLRNLLIKPYFNKWRQQINKLEIKDLKNEIFGQFFNHFDKTRKKGNLYNAFNKWRYSKPKDILPYIIK